MLLQGRNILVFGGALDLNTASTTNRADVYDVFTKRWARAAPMLRDRALFGFTQLGDRVYVAGGISKGAIIGDVEVFHLGNKSWVTSRHAVSCHATPALCQHIGTFASSSGKLCILLF